MIAEARERGPATRGRRALARLTVGLLGVAIVAVALVAWHARSSGPSVTRYAGRDYVFDASCGTVPPRAQLAPLPGFPAAAGTPLRVRTPTSTPIEVYVLSGGRCTGVYSLEGGP